MAILPVTGSMEETDVTLPEAEVTKFDTGLAMLLPAMGLVGAVPTPFQPRLIVPTGARSVPLCVMVDV